MSTVLSCAAAQSILYGRTKFCTVASMSKRKRPVQPEPDSSDEEAPAANPRARERRVRPLFDKNAIYNAVVGEHPKAVRTHLRSHFADDGVLADWQAWLKDTPEVLSEVAAEAHALPMRMPTKFAARAPAPMEAAPMRVQPELMIYNNPDGTAYGKEQRQRDAIASRPLRRDELTVGKTVAIRRDPADPWEPLGYGTPLYFGDILSVETAAGGSEEEPHSLGPLVKELTVHYRIPLLRGAWCNEIVRPLKLACVHCVQWEPACETRPKCVAKRAPGAVTSKMTAVVSADALYEADLKLVSSGALSMSARRRLAEANSSWRKALGLEVVAAEGASSEHE